MNLWNLLTYLTVILLTIIGFQYSYAYQLQKSSLKVFMGGGISRGDLLPKLLSLVSNTKKGVVKDSNSVIIELIDEISKRNAVLFENNKAVTNKLNGKWRLLWTTEKETLFFASNGLFGSPVTSIIQDINFESKQINNLIEFKDKKSFSVLGVISLDENIKQRVNFKFSKAIICIPPIQLPLPPIGQGWFDNIYVNDKYRISKDIRGDYLVSERID